MSLQNGVDNVETIHAASGIDALPAVVYIAAVLPEPGHVKHLGRGELAVGELTSGGHRRGRLHLRDRHAPEKIAALFASAGVPCRISEYIEADIWAKFIMNCAGNAVAAIAQCSYAEAVQNSGVARIDDAIDRRDGGSGPRGRDPPTRLKSFMEEGIKSLGSFGNATSSTAHDLARGKRTEIESLNGYVVRRGEELGVATPAAFLCTPW